MLSKALKQKISRQPFGKKKSHINHSFLITGWNVLPQLKLTVTAVQMINMYQNITCVNNILQSDVVRSWNTVIQVSYCKLHE